MIVWWEKGKSKVMSRTILFSLINEFILPPHKDNRMENPRN
jgi:hypothetical protein